MPAVASNRQDLVRSLFAAVDDMDVDGVAAHLSDDVVLAFGSSEPVAGKAGFEQTTIAFFAALRGLRHEIGDVWQPEPDVVITEMTVHYTRLDGGQLSLPCCNVFRFRGDLICDYRIYMDANPVFAPAGDDA